MRCFLRGFTFLAVTVSTSSVWADEPRSGDQRVPWTSSKFAGSPDPPAPYTAELAFPRLTFDRPLLLAHIPGDRRLVVAEIAGKVLSFPANPMADRADLAVDLAKARPGTSAVYGLAFHPRFIENRQVFICYVMGEGPDGSRVARFTMSRTDPPIIDPASEEVVITWVAGGHNGGCLQFGPDGFLYISTGDAASPSPPDPLDTGQNIGDLPSSILRIDVDHRESGRAYRVPADNPFVGLSGARPEVWAFGFRNPWRMSFDRVAGDLWVGDVGWELWELIYRVERGGNYGWSIKEGRQSIRPSARQGPSPILPPTVDHAHSEAASITGGYVYRGARLNDLVGCYIYGDYQSGKIWGLRHDGKRVTWQGELADTGLRIASFGEDADGELYIVEYERSNQIFRLVPNTVRDARGEFPRLLSRTGLFASTRDHQPSPGVLPYSINAAAWCDGARAERFLAVPGTARIALGEEGRLKLPEGSVLARTVSLELAAGDPKSQRRLETQILHFEAGSWRPYTYLWNDDQSDATLADASGASRTFVVQDESAASGRREQPYRFAARSECILCHNPWVEARTTVFGRQSASPLALETAQLDRGSAPDRTGENQLRRLELLGFFEKPLTSARPPRLADPYDTAADLDARARAYLQVNCSHCHQFNAGGATTISLSASVPLDKTQTIGARPSQGSFGIDDARIITPRDPDRSVLFYRVTKTGSGRMPRLGSHRVDTQATRMIADWIARMPQPSGTDPPAPASKPDAGDLERLKKPNGVSVAARSEAIHRLTASTQHALALVRSIDRGEVPDLVIREVAALTKDNPRGEIRDLFERFLPDDQRIRRLGDPIDPAIILALSGDAGRGRQLFTAESAAQCKSCHRLGNVGTELGPDLAGIGAKYPRPDLLRHILEPAREVDPKFSLYAIATKDGQILTGLLVEKTGRDVVLRDPQNREIRVPVANIEQQGSRPGSLMPDRLLSDLTAQQAADLLEYLGSLKATPARTATGGPG
jgi:uncharacterized repeat protein (TIGR03806 family)